MSTGAKVVIIVVVLIGVIVLATAASVYLFFRPIATPVPTPGPVTVTGLYLFIVYPNYTSTTGYFGSQYQSLKSGPIFLQHGETYNSSFILSLQPAETTHYVDRVDLAFSGGFTLKSASPNPPFPVAPPSAIVTVTMQAPSTDYDGPVTIDLYTH